MYLKKKKKVQNFKIYTEMNLTKFLSMKVPSLADELRSYKCKWVYQNEMESWYEFGMNFSCDWLVGRDIWKGK